MLEGSVARRPPAIPRGLRPIIVVAQPGQRLGSQHAVCTTRRCSGAPAIPLINAGAAVDVLNGALAFSDSACLSNGVADGDRGVGVGRG